MYLIYRTASIHQAVKSRSARVDDIGDHFISVTPGGKSLVTAGI